MPSSYDTALLKDMLRQVNAGGFGAQTEIYAAAFNAAELANKPLPCPYCFCQGTDATLEHLPAKGNFGAVLCGRCRGRFAFMEAGE